MLYKRSSYYLSEVIKLLLELLTVCGYDLTNEIISSCVGSLGRGLPLVEREDDEGVKSIPVPGGV